MVTRPLECAGEREQFSEVIGCSGDILGTCRDLAALAVYFAATLVFVAGTSGGYDKAVAGRLQWLSELAWLGRPIGIDGDGAVGQLYRRGEGLVAVVARALESCTIGCASHPA